jgi:hypothetical protein
MHPQDILMMMTMIQGVWPVLLMFMFWTIKKMMMIQGVACSLDAHVLGVLGDQESEEPV